VSVVRGASTGTSVRPPRRTRARLRALAATLAVGAASLVPATGAASALETYLVTFDAPPTAEQLESLAGVAVGVHSFTHLPVAAVVAAPVDRSLLTNLPDVRRVDPDRSFRPLLRGSTSTMRADAAWDLGWTGEGVGIAVIDTGIDGTHPDLCAAPEFCRGTDVQTVQNVKILGRQSVAPEPVVVLEDQLSTDTSSGHGTHVAGIAGGAGTASSEPGAYRGVAPAAHLVGLGTGEAVEAVNVLAAFDWVIEHADTYDLKVINNSWGPGPGQPYDPDYPVQRAIDAAHAAGLTVVFGAGNDGPATDSLNAFSANPKALSVAAGDKDGHLAFFSSRGVPGSERWRPTVTAPGYHIAAPRAATGFLTHLSDLLAPNPDPIAPEDLPAYASGSGTSMASPHVAGLVALLQQAAVETRGVWLTPDEVQDILEATAASEAPARGPGGLPSYQRYTMGAGYVDAEAAVQAAASGVLPTPAAAPVVEVAGFAGQVGPSVLLPTTTFDTTFEVRDGAITLDVMIDWGLHANDVDLELFAPDGTRWGGTFLRCDPDDHPNGYSSFCSSQANERLTVTSPTPGTWRAVVQGGLLSTIEDVTGLWSAVYPPGTSVPTRHAGAVTLATLAPLGVATGTEVEVTATVTDDTGAPLPGAIVTWSSEGPGAVVLGEAETRADGRATARLRSDAPGIQLLRASVDGVDGTLDVTWVGLALTSGTSTPGRVSGGGWLDDDGRHTFAFFAEHRVGADAPSGELRFQAPSGQVVRAEGVDRLVVDGDRAVMRGPASIDGTTGYRFRLEVQDGGSAGRGGDHLELRVTSPLGFVVRSEVAGPLGGGNVQVRAG
jgi:serine protease AprX